MATQPPRANDGGPGSVAQPSPDTTMYTPQSYKQLKQHSHQPLAYAPLRPASSNDGPSLSTTTDSQRVQFMCLPQHAPAPYDSFYSNYAAGGGLHSLQGYQTHFPAPQEGDQIMNHSQDEKAAAASDIDSQYHIHSDFSKDVTRRNLEDNSGQESDLAGEYDFLNEYQSDNDEISDADSVSYDYRRSIAKYKNSVRIFRAAHNGSEAEQPLLATRGRRRIGGRGSRGRYRARGSRVAGVRKPRQPAPLTGDIKYRLAEASQAFIEERIEDCLRISREIIRINAETFEAWILTASCLQELGHVEKALDAMLFAAYLRKNEQEVWFNCARYALEQNGVNRSHYLKIAKLCYSRAVNANPLEDVDARLKKALVLREIGTFGAAIVEYKRVLMRQPHNLTILRLMAETFIDLDHVEDAKKLYWQSIIHYKDLTGTELQMFDWSDLNIFIELYSYLGQYSEAITQLKALSRWLLGRQSEEYWDKHVDDDSEWDIDESRRVIEPGFDTNRFQKDQYGAGLPLELRIKLGIFRLRLGDHKEAIQHLAHLDPENSTGSDLITDYPELFRDAADGLFDAQLFQDAIHFYSALQERLETEEAYISMRLGKCHLKSQQDRQAEECFRCAALIDLSDMESRMYLAKMYERLGDQEQAFYYVNEVMAIQRRNAPPEIIPKRRGRPPGSRSKVIAPRILAPKLPRPKSAHNPHRTTDTELRCQQEASRSARLQEQYTTMRAAHHGMHSGQEVSMGAWMNAARELIDDFRGFRAFFPWDKYVRFMGYTGKAAPETGAAPLDADVADMAERLSSKLGVDVKAAVKRAQIPANYRGISFSDWLDIFLQYALCLVKMDRLQEAYSICESAWDSIVWYHSKEDRFLIHLCWCTCALYHGDEKTCLHKARHFTSDYQFSTDAYRMFSALAKLMQAPSSWYSSGPTQKYMLRQIKAMDYSLLPDNQRKTMSEKASYSHINAAKQPIVNDDLDLSLLMMYGHILGAGGSYQYALNYFYRALAVDPHNPMISLSIGLAYVHMGLKRQSDNRQFCIMQGLSFLFRYYDMRITSSRVDERQEAHYCIARTYHIVGLTHLAIPYYSKVLQEAHDAGPSRDDLACDAAYNLQTMYLSVGNSKLATFVTREWLVL